LNENKDGFPEVEEQIHYETGPVQQIVFDYNRAFRTDYVAIDPQLLEKLAEFGVMTVGIDTPSVDLFESKTLDSHQMAKRYNLAILEGLELKGVPEGIYELIALPLKLRGFDASPVRAILRTI
jgi:arylformamidase